MVYRYFDTKESRQIASKEYDENNKQHLKKESLVEYTAHKGAFEQVLYFSNSINEEELTNEDWVAVMKNWASHMKSKFNRLMINSQVHKKDEATSHIHITFSCLNNNGSTLTYQAPQIKERGYGSNLQDDFESVFASTMKERFKLLKYEYNRGEKKKSYREVGNDHVRSKDQVEQLETVNEIYNAISDESLSVVDTLKHIRGLKATYKGNKEAIKMLNKLQGVYKKLNKQESNINNNEKYLGELLETQENLKNYFESDLNTMEDLINFIKEQRSVLKYQRSRRERYNRDFRYPFLLGPHLVS